MAKKNMLLIIAAILLVAGSGMIAFGDTKGPEPKLVCVEEGTPSSGFADPEQGDCPVSIESTNEWREWNNQAQPVKIAGAGMVLVSLLLFIGVGVGAIVGAVKNGRQDAGVR